MISDAKSILAMEKPGDLFSPNVAKMKSEYKNLAKMWHPDVHSDPALASQVMSKINELYETGLQLLREGKWAKSNFVQFRSLDGKMRNVNFLAELPFELGKCYVCRSVVVYAVDVHYKQFFDNYIHSVENLKFADANMKAEFTRFLPRIRDRFQTSDQYVIAVEKPYDVLPLRHILDHFGGTLPDRHVAWILSSLYNIACFLNYNGVAHNGITLDNYFISPSQHNGMLLGGWWYSRSFGDRMIGVPTDVFGVLTFKTQADKLSTYTTDLNSIRQLGRQLLGDISGRSLKSKPDIPKPILDWMLGASTKNPLEEYSAWGKTLDVGYGKRKFVDMNVSADDLYSR